ncbi:MAG: UDP-N-acetylmuramoyl-tripeptide--D-alanyl-D-alanine ligase [Planctomycetes bacterium]|nr:UDP-N-acetylmuramoyl-tripeptide--D-alanyl-D-alanine ligase [Planctomycetota bacterium]
MRALRLADIISCTRGNLLNRNIKVNGLLVRRISTDTRSLKKGDLFVALKGANFDGHKFIPQAEKGKASSIIVSVKPARLPAKVPVIKVSDTTRALGDIARFYRRLVGARIIAITGSNGKTTTKEMIYHILSTCGCETVRSPKSFNNAVGVPVTMFSIDAFHKYAIFEVGTNHPGEIAYLAGIIRPDIAVITNIGASHLDGLGSLKAVAREKASLLKSLGKNGIAIILPNNKLLAPYLKKALYKTVTIPSARAVASSGGFRFTFGKYHGYLPVMGACNISNAMAALATVRALGIDIKRAVNALKSFHLPAMRMEKESAGGVTFINDAYNSNPQSAAAAIHEMKSIDAKGRKILVFGSMNELGAYSKKYHAQIADEIISAKPDAVLAVGEETRITAQRIYEKFPRTGKIVLSYFSSAAQAGDYLGSYLKKGDLVLLKGSRAVGLEETLKRAKHALKRK